MIAVNFPPVPSSAELTVAGVRRHLERALAGLERQRHEDGQVDRYSRSDLETSVLTRILHLLNTVEEVNADFPMQLRRRELQRLVVLP